MSPNMFFLILFCEILFFSSYSFANDKWSLKSIKPKSELFFSFPKISSEANNSFKKYATPCNRVDASKYLIDMQNAALMSKLSEISYNNSFEKDGYRYEKGNFKK